MRLLMVGRLSGQLAEASRIAMANGASVAHVDGLEPAMAYMRAKGADLVIADVALDIGHLVMALEAERFSTPVVACGVDTGPQQAAAAIKKGAREFLPLPPDAELIAALIQAVADDSRPFLHADPMMDPVVRLADQVAPSDASILITGESGTGKEVMARYVHAKSRRAQNAFVSVNCAAIPENLLESELFGHEKGAFTGALARRIGKFEEAHGGTLLLDEISEMDLRLQAKLLRAVQEREIDRVGGSGPVKVNIRIVATSNRDLKQAVKDGTFREDLYFRLNVVNLQLPPLRVRKADIRAIATHFAKKFAQDNGIKERAIDEAGFRALEAHDWPGNVRELENTMHRAVLLATGPVISAEAVSLPDGSRATPAPTHDSGGQAAAGLVGRTVAEVERDLIIDTLRHCLGNRTHAANILGISIRTLRNKLNEYQSDGINVPPPGEGQAAI